MAEPTSLSILLSVARPLLGAARLILQMSDSPRFVVEVDSVNHVGIAERDWLEWPHLLVTNVGQARARGTATASGARATVRFGEHPMLRLMWQTPRGPTEERDLVGAYKGETRSERIPFVIRHTRPFHDADMSGGALFGPRLGGEIGPVMQAGIRVAGKYGAFALFGRFSLIGGRCYATDEHVLSQSSADQGGLILGPGQHRGHLTITYDTKGRQTEEIVVDVPSADDPRGRIEVRIARSTWRARYRVKSPPEG